MPFIPTRTLSPNAATVTERFVACVSAAAFIGDGMRVSAGVAKPATAVSATNTVLGVAIRFYDPNGKPMTHSQPTRGPYKPAATSGFVDVAMGAETVFTCTADGCSTLATANALIGLRIGVTAGTPNSATGQSGQKLLGSTTYSTAAEGLWKVVGYDGGNLTAGEGIRLEVVPAFPLFG